MQFLHHSERATLQFIFRDIDEFCKNYGEHITQFLVESQSFLYYCKYNKKCTFKVCHKGDYQCGILIRGSGHAKGYGITSF